MNEDDIHQPTPYPMNVYLKDEEELKVFVAEQCSIFGLEPLWQPRPGESHDIDQAFYNLAILERDYERHLNVEMRELLNKLRKELEAKAG